MKTTILRFLLPLLILGGGFGISRWIATQAPQVERKAAPKQPVLVEVMTVEGKAQQASVQATGLVTPAQQIVLIPQVTGEVRYLSPSMVPGGHVKKGELLVRIDPRDYKLAVEQQQGNLRSAALQVELEQAQAELARHEWQVLGEEGAPSPLFSRDSQAAAAEANLEAGRSTLDRAKLSLSRTSLHAPFDATVVSESVDIGQVVGPQSQLAQLIGTGEMWVMVSVPVEELALLQIPGVNAEQGSNATVSQRLANGKAIERTGQVSRLVDQLDQRTRRAQVVVSISGALDPKLGLPLLAGAHVQVAIEGQEFERVFQVPRSAVYEGNTVWIAQADSTIAPRKLSSAWGDADHLYVTEGLEDGEELVTTRLSAPITGMEVTKTAAVAASKPSPVEEQVASAEDAEAAAPSAQSGKAEPESNAAAEPQQPAKPKIAAGSKAAVSEGTKAN